MKQPPVTQELLDWLRQKFPDRIPRKLVSDRELAMKIGEQRVIRKLEDLYDTYLHG